MPLPPDAMLPTQQEVNTSTNKTASCGTGGREERQVGGRRVGRDERKPCPYLATERKAGQRFPHVRGAGCGTVAGMWTRVENWRWGAWLMPVWVKYVGWLDLLVSVAYPSCLSRAGIFSPFNRKLRDTPRVLSSRVSPCCTHIIRGYSEFWRVGTF